MRTNGQDNLTAKLHLPLSALFLLCGLQNLILSQLDSANSTVIDLSLFKDSYLKASL